MENFEKLNEQQKEAVLHKEGPLLVLAGAGAGKTKVITLRIYELIKTGVSPKEILAITFTNKAAKEMRERVFSLLYSNKSSGYQGYYDEKPYVGTFHSLGVQILRENHTILGLPKHFSIYDKNDSISTIKEVLKELGFDPKEFSPVKILGIISKMKGDFIDREEYSSSFDNSFMGRTVSLVWEKYERALKKEGGLDFGDLLLETAKLLSNNEEIRKNYQRRWKYLHIDEYQDTNKVQYVIVSLLASGHKNIFVVGDVDQNIYSWRGANIRNILNFEKDFEKPKIIMLEQNYRSTKNIIEASNKIIEKNKNRYDKKLFTTASRGEKIGAFTAYDEKEEAFFVANKSEQLIRQGIDPNEIAVLYRANFQSRNLEEAFLSKNIPYQVLGVRFFERKEVKDVLSFIKAALNPESLSDVKRIINVPPRGIGKVTLLKMFSGKESELTPTIRRKVDDFKSLLKKIREEIKNKKPKEVIKFIINVTGLEEKLKTGTEDDLERLENIKELVSLGEKYNELESEDGILKLLEEAALASEQDSLEERSKKNKNGVKLMTIHASKGLEFEYVFITGLEDGLFPHNKDFDDENKDEEEERRLFYVALTRAKKKVCLTYAGERTIFGGRQINLPSEFLTELDGELLEQDFLENNEQIIEVD
jgi:DNA helicase II / ATP-dependent DNA helicase PcrA